MTKVALWVKIFRRDLRELLLQAEYEPRLSVGPSQHSRVVN